MKLAEHNTPFEAVGVGMVPLDIMVTASFWLAGLMTIYACAKMNGRESPRGTAARWGMGVGFFVVAAMLTLRLVQWGDIPMSLPYACGLLLITVCYIVAAYERIRAGSGT